jgi:hypothetical protein
LPLPIDFKDRKDKVSILISNLKAEDIANQRSPLSPQMVAEFIRKGKAADHLSFKALATDVIMSGGQQGYRASETTTKKKTKPDYFKYPGSKRRVVKAMCVDWWTTYDNKNDVIEDGLLDKASVEKMKLRWKIQKNRRNNEPVTRTQNKTDPDFCTVDRTLSMMDRARQLGQPDHLPLCVYKDEKGQMKYLTLADLTSYIREVARAVHPNMPKSEWMKFSCHSQSGSGHASYSTKPAEKGTTLKNNCGSSVTATESIYKIQIPWQINIMKAWKDTHHSYGR